MLEAEAVAVFADAFAVAIAHVAADYGHDAHLRTCEVALGGYVVGPSEFVGVFGGDGEGEFGLVVGCGDGAGRDGEVAFDGFGEGEAERSVVELLRDEFSLVRSAGDWFDVG